jgi:hypothetical protein
VGWASASDAAHEPLPLAGLLTVWVMALSFAITLVLSLLLVLKDMLMLLFRRPQKLSPFDVPFPLHRRKDGPRSSSLQIACQWYSASVLEE